MSNTFTPGPWFQSHRRVESGNYRTEVYCPKGETIASFAWYPMPEDEEGATGTYRPGNAQLTAAAPEMLDALEDALDWLESWEDLSAGTVCRKVRAAIARAIGATA